MKDVIIVGAGGFGREVAWLIEDINKYSNEWNIVGFVDDNIHIQGKVIDGYRVVGTIDWLKSQQYFVVIAIGDPMVRSSIVKRLESSKNSYPVLIHPSVLHSDRVSFGDGTIICAGNIITVDIKVGKHAILNLGCTIGHDVTIGDLSTLSPNVNISGRVTIEECVSIGTNAVVIPGIHICSNTVIGAGATVVQNINETGTYVGTPAKKTCN